MYSVYKCYYLMQSGCKTQEATELAVTNFAKATARLSIIRLLQQQLLQ